MKKLKHILSVSAVALAAILLLFNVTGCTAIPGSELAGRDAGASYGASDERRWASDYWGAYNYWGYDGWDTYDHWSHGHFSAGYPYY